MGKTYQGGLPILTWWRKRERPYYMVSKVCVCYYHRNANYLACPDPMVVKQRDTPLIGHASGRRWPVRR
jgi:hypothetical protein